MGALVNGLANDRCAAWTPDGSVQVILFDSDRPEGFASKDLWRVERLDGPRGRQRTTAPLGSPAPGAHRRSALQTAHAPAAKKEVKP
jgi:hypothetical protein